MIVNKELSKRMLNNTLWSVLGQGGYLGIALVTNIVLVRILDPYIFGQIGVLMFLIVVSTVLIESGLSGALIRKKQVEDKDYSTVFLFNMFVSCLIFIIVYFLSDSIANFYNDEELRNIIIILSFSLVINSLRITQNIKLMRELRFKEKVLYEFISIFLASVISITLALVGFEVWSLVALQILASIFLTILLWVFVGPLTYYKFNMTSFKEMYRFGFNTTLASLLDTIFNNIYQIFLGKYFSITQVGYFYQAKRLQEIPVGVMQISISGVVYSGLSKLKEEKYMFEILFDNIYKILVFLSVMIFTSIIFYSDIIVSILYGENWSASIFYLKLLSIAAIFYTLEIYFKVIFKIFNKTDYILKIEIIKKVIQSITILYGIHLMSIDFLLYGFVGVSFLGFILSYIFSYRVVGFQLRRNLKVLLIVFLLNLSFYFIGKWMVSLYGLSSFVQILLYPLVVFLYIHFAYVFSIFDFYKFLNKLFLFKRF